MSLPKPLFSAANRARCGRMLLYHSVPNLRRGRSGHALNIFQIRLVSLQVHGGTRGKQLSDSSPSVDAQMRSLSSGSSLAVRPHSDMKALL